MQIVATSSSWYRVSSPDCRSGYLPANSLEDVNRAINKIRFAETTELLQSPFQKAAPISALPSEEEVAVIGKNGEYQLVRDAEGGVGWIPVIAK